MDRDRGKRASGEVSGVDDEDKGGGGSLVKDMVPSERRLMRGGWLKGEMLRWW